MVDCRLAAKAEPLLKLLWPVETSGEQASLAVIAASQGPNGGLRGLPCGSMG
jgi:hypothetical protein